MGLMDKIRGEFIDIIEWTDDSRDTMVYRFPRYQNEIKMGAKLGPLPCLLEPALRSGIGGDREEGEEGGGDGQRLAPGAGNVGRLARGFARGLARHDLRASLTAFSWPASGRAA